MNNSPQSQEIIEPESEPQIWFLRTDKDDFSGMVDISNNAPYIYSAHGICALESPNHKPAKQGIFPKLQLSEKEVRDLVHREKLIQVESGSFNSSDRGKTYCDVVICYWIAVMRCNDIVFVRNKQNDLYVCRISGYLSEDIFDKFGLFARPVEIIATIHPDNTNAISKFDGFWHRTLGRRTIERNRNPMTSKLALNLVKSFEAQ